MKRMQQTNTTHNEKVVHVVYSSDAFKEMEILEYGTDGLAEEPSNLSIFGEKTLESSITQTVKVLSLVMKVSQMNISTGVYTFIHKTISRGTFFVGPNKKLIM